MNIDKMLSYFGLARLPRQPRQPSPLWEENGFRVVVGTHTFLNGRRVVRELVLERLDNFVWQHVESGQYLRHPCFSYDSKRQALRKLQAKAREEWASGVRRAGHFAESMC